MNRRKFSSEKSIGGILNTAFSPMGGKNKIQKAQRYLPINLRKY